MHVDPAVFAAQPSYAAAIVVADGVPNGPSDAAGDALLREVSALMENRLRRGDMVARVGGDEFAAVLHDCNLGTAVAVAQSICEQVENYELAWGDARHRVGVSIGVVQSDESFKSGAQMMATADAACYEAKKAGRGQVRAAPR